MWNRSTVFLVLAVACLVAGFLGRHIGMVDGLGKALFGVFMILFFITRFFGTPSNQHD